jgi:tetratricopeptide (TPR) repeat protein
MFLTHVDPQGNDTPAVLVENSTASNRAVNIPEFVNIPPDGLLKIDAPVTEYYRLIDVASEAMNRGEHAAALPLLKRAVAESPGDAVVHNSYASALAATGRVKEAVAEYRRATALSPDYPDAHNNLASALVQTGRPDEAVGEFRRALALKPDFAEAHSGLGGALAQAGKVDEAIPHLQKAVELGLRNPGALANLCLALSLAGRPQEAIPRAREAVALSGGQDPLILDLLGRLYGQAGRLPEAIETTRQAVDVAARTGDERLVRDLRARLGAYEAARGGGARGRP